MWRVRVFGWCEYPGTHEITGYLKVRHRTILDMPCPGVWRSVLLSVTCAQIRTLNEPRSSVEGTQGMVTDCDGGDGTVTVLYSELEV